MCSLATHNRFRELASIHAASLEEQCSHGSIKRDNVKYRAAGHLHVEVLAGVLVWFYVDRHVKGASHLTWLGSQFVTHRTSLWGIVGSSSSMVARLASSISVASSSP